jgi:ppGpp synthetase/RelA/SpoT-type nucleotidyltranferase
MAERKQITPATHREQITKYDSEQSPYRAYAEVLRRVLGNACRTFFPDALVQARSKTLSSFAEKAARRFDKYPDAVNQMTDLCGARVTVQTIEQVEAVKLFVKANFIIHEEDEKSVLLGEDKFGYRDVHFIIELHPDRCAVLGITPDERKTIDRPLRSTSLHAR